MSSESFLEPGDHYRSKLPALMRKVASSSVYYLTLVWLIRTVVFVLWAGKCILIWLLRFSFLLLRYCTRRYLSVALLQLTLTPPSTRQQGGSTQTDEKVNLLEHVSEGEVEVTTSPLLPVVVKDRVQICEENLGLEDRFGLNSSDSSKGHTSR